MTRPAVPASSVAAFALLGVVVAEVAAATAFAAVVGLSVADLVDGFVVTNLTIGLSCGLAGLLIAWQRPRNPVGWLLLAAAVCQSTSGLGVPLGALGLRAGWPDPALRSIATAISYAWPLSIATFLPLALLMFPDGLRAGRARAAAIALVAVNGVLFTVSSGGEPGSLPADPWLVLPGYAALAPLWTATEVFNLAVFVLAVGALVVRYRHGDERRRRQLLWLVLALLGVVAIMAPWGLFQSGPILQLLAIALVPAAIAIAVLRHQLLDIRLVLSRALVYALLTVAVLGFYTALVAGAGELAGGVGLGGSVLVTLLIAIGFDPVRVRLQRLADRLLYGDRADPVRALARIGDRLAGTDQQALLVAVCEALRLPSAALVRGGTQIARHGEPGPSEDVPLLHGGKRIGELIVGVRRGQGRLSRRDRAALEVLAAPLAVAVQATALTEELRRSQVQIIATREEERRRLRHDLHDGLGPALTGIAFQADAAGNLAGIDPQAAERVLQALRTAATAAIADVRRIVYGLRPPALDEIGLAETLRRFASQLGPEVTVEACELPELPAAVEAAAHRIAVEALTNAVRHAGGPVRLQLTAATDLEIVVTDRGSSADQWTPGVGLTSLFERAAEVGGTVQAGPAPTGGRVRAVLPLRLGEPDATPALPAGGAG